MTATAPPDLRVVCFGDLEGAVWGSMVDLGEPAIVFASPDGVDTSAGATAVRLAEDQVSWILSGEGFDLKVTPAPGHPESDAELCNVSGTVTVAGRERTLAGFGVRNTASEVRGGRWESLRGVSGWFDADHGLTLLALRPSGSKGQEGDLVAATLFDPEGWTAVQDPRLSTTYRDGDRPVRASLEMWVGEGEEQYPRRAAAEALGDPAIAQRDGLRLEVTPMRCHARGLDGAGVYLLAHLR